MYEIRKKSKSWSYRGHHGNGLKKKSDFYELVYNKHHVSQLPVSTKNCKWRNLRDLAGRQGQDSRQGTGASPFVPQCAPVQKGLRASSAAPAVSIDSKSIVVQCKMNFHRQPQCYLVITGI